jgi:hypothetical protein
MVLMKKTKCPFINTFHCLRQQKVIDGMQLKQNSREYTLVFILLGEIIFHLWLTKFRGGQLGLKCKQLIYYSRPLGSIFYIQLD